MIRFSLYISVLFVCGHSQTHVLTFLFMTSFGQFGMNTSGVVPAVDMAVRDINNRSGLLPGYTIAYDRVRDSQCHSDRSLDAFFQGIQSAPVKLAVIGCGCSVATEPVAAISHHWNITQISYFSESASLSDRRRYKKYFRTNPSGLVEYPAFYSIMSHFGWKQIAIITQNEDLFTTAEANIRKTLKSANYTVTSSTFDTMSDPWTTTKSLFSQGFHVFFLNCYSGPARRIICQAAKLNYSYPHYAWIIQHWYADKWWIPSPGDDDGVDCTEDQLEAFLSKALSVRIHPSPDEYATISDAGLLPEQFQTEYESFAQQSGYSVSDAGGRAYDAIWVLALALNRTMAMVKSGNINGTGCENASGPLVPLEQFVYSNEKMGCLIQWNIQRTNISGVTGPLWFDANGTRVQNAVHLYQYMHYGQGNLSRVPFAYLLIQENYSFRFLSGSSDNQLYSDGIPPDGLPIEILKTYSIPMVIVIDVLSALGLGFTLICCLFNLIFRNERVVRLSSAKLNYLIILGAMLMYSSVYFYILPTTVIDIVKISCVLKEWLFMMGYALCFGTVLAKMWRIYYIFQNPRSKKLIITDWHMLFIVGTMIGIGVLLLTIGTAVPDLKGNVIKEIDNENPNGITVGGVQENYYHLMCYPTSSSPFYWKILILAYLAVYQIVGIVLAFETRKVKFPGLKDSAFIATMIYISSLVLVMLAVDTFLLSSYLNSHGAIYAIGIIILTTLFLSFTFIPKMVLLYRGTDISAASFSMDAAPRKSCDLEAKVASLELVLREKDKMIATFENQIAALKERTTEDASQC